MPGQLLRFHAKFDKAIHAECKALQRAVVAAADCTLAMAEERLDLPAGLQPKTLVSYLDEFGRYVRFAERMWSEFIVPGRDEVWNAFLLWKFMLFRAEKCKPTTVFSSLSALAHCGVQHGYVLPTTKWDGNALFYRQIKNMKREISRMYRASRQVNGATYDVLRSTPVGASSISLILSHFQVVDERSFLRLSRANRHHIAVSMMQHTCGMRFGHFMWRKYTVASFPCDLYGTYRLLTDWHRYSGQRSYCLEFAREPRWPCLRYAVYGADGTRLAYLVTAQVMSWHFNQLESVGESVVFAPKFGWTPSRAQRKAWLQSTLLAALHPHETEVRRLVQLVSPHAFRAGLAGDLLRAGVPPQTIAIWCRWWSMRAMRLYAERQELCCSRVAIGCRLANDER